ncbi:hypothetical protein EVAR_3057_1 [Eumeta japonica]|uniref:Uncharacterized protein n=1 Tax=Eumeta variegata TaxID=151549 RepID=A0A4C1SUK2_EUMVA|nr:hypothetical protein EVAR_3057_1 [Eumeta japonica]
MTRRCPPPAPAARARQAAVRALSLQVSGDRSSAKVLGVSSPHSISAHRYESSYYDKSSFILESETHNVALPRCLYKSEIVRGTGPRTSRRTGPGRGLI